MGGRGSSGGGLGSKDGVFTSNKTRTIETVYREARSGFGGSSYYKDEVLEATTDGKGNITFDYARGGSYEKTAKTNRTNYVTFNLKAGAVNGETFNIDWSKVQSVQGKTYSLRDAAKSAGLKWDGATKSWRRK